MTSGRIAVGYLLVALMGAGVTSAPFMTDAFASDRPASSGPSVAGPEAMLVKSLQEIADSRIDSGLNGIEQVLQANPNFRLAHLIKGDMLLARTRPISDMGETDGIAQQQITDLREEARARVRRHLEPVPSDRVPKYLLKMQPEQKYAAIADTSKSRLYVYQNLGDKVRYVADYYISSGKTGRKS